MGLLRELRLRWRARRWRRRVERVVAAWRPPLRVNGPTRLSRATTLGANANFNGLTVIGPGRVTIGDNFHSGRGCVIRTATHNHRGAALPYDETYIVEDVSIGDNVWLGEGVLVLPGVTIGEGAIIQARSVVVSDIPPLAIAGGHPCRPFSQRDPERYAALKAAGRFT